MEDDELELDIDELSNDVLYQLLQFVRKHAPKAEDPARSAPTPAPAGTTASRKKNKPMSKVEQENRIQQVRGSLSAFDNPGSGIYAAGAGMYLHSPQRLRLQLTSFKIRVPSRKEETPAEMMTIARRVKKSKSPCPCTPNVRCGSLEEILPGDFSKLYFYSMQQKNLAALASVLCFERKCE